MASKGSTSSRSQTSGVASWSFEYWTDSMKPLACLVFVAPMLLAYEGGLLCLGPRALRNGADQWLRRLLESIGFTHYFLLPVLTCGILLAWHHLRRERWQVSGKVFAGMCIECLLFGAVLLILAHWHSQFVSQGRAFVVFSTGLVPGGRFIGYLGAGIYEELLFRLMLLPPLIALFRHIGISPGKSLAAAVLVGSLLFAAAHYRLELGFGSWNWQMGVGESFAWTSFLFRSLAGAFFSLLFLYRGFGIAAGTHALYDILVAAW